MVDDRFTTLGGTGELADADIAPVAAMIGDRTRAAMLWALSDGRALPAGELARAGRVRASAGSAHLAKLVSAELLRVERFGRHRYYRLAQPGIIPVLEALAAVAAPKLATDSRDAHAGQAVRRARTCYDHVAGTLGVAITEGLLRSRALVQEGRAYHLTSQGEGYFTALGLRLDLIVAACHRTRRPLATACLDWSERRYHLAGALGAALCARLLALEWVQRRPASRALRITNIGRRELRRRFSIDHLY